MVLSLTIRDEVSKLGLGLKTRIDICFGASVSKYVCLALFSFSRAAAGLGLEPFVLRLVMSQ